MPSEHSDCELLAACAKREAWAWDALVDRYAGLVYGVALRAGLSRDDAADVFQNVFAALLTHLGDIRAPQGLAAWLITTSKREAWRTLRRDRREPLAGEVPAILDASAAWRRDAHAEERRWADRVLIDEALEQVGKRCRQLLVLLYLDPGEPSYEEISTRMKMPLGSIGPTRARCLQRMRELLCKMGMGEA